MHFKRCLGHITFVKVVGRWLFQISESFISILFRVIRGIHWRSIRTQDYGLLTIRRESIRSGRITCHKCTAM